MKSGRPRKAPHCAASTNRRLISVSRSEPTIGSVSRCWPRLGRAGNTISVASTRPVVEPSNKRLETGCFTREQGRTARDNRRSEYQSSGRSRPFEARGSRRRALSRSEDTADQAFVRGSADLAWTSITLSRLQGTRAGVAATRPSWSNSRSTARELRTLRVFGRSWDDAAVRAPRQTEKRFVIGRQRDQPDDARRWYPRADWARFPGPAGVSSSK